MDLAEAQQELEWRRCRGSGPTDLLACVYFLEAYWHIRHPERGCIPFALRPAQRETLEHLFGEKFVIILKARQIGFTSLLAAYAFWLTYFHPDKAVLMISRTEREAVYMLGMTKYGARFLPEWMKTRGPVELTDHQQKVKFDNESQIESLPSQKDPARGMTAYQIIVDEWASLENPEEAWASIEPVADIGGRVCGLSTAKGYGSFFHQMWLGAVRGDNRFRPIFHPWSAVPDRDQAWYDAEAAHFQAVGTPWIIHQEYPSDPDEAFVKSGMNVFDVEFLQTLQTDEGMHGDYRDYGYGWEYHEQAAGPLAIWEFPEPTGTYAIGADVAEGLDFGDYSSAHVVDCRSGLVVAHYHAHLSPDLFGEYLANLGAWYNGALLGVEVNNHGLTTVTALMRLNYPNIYFSKPTGQWSQKQSPKAGWITNVATKPLMIDELARALRNGDVAVRDEATISELKTYVREPDGKKMHGSPHDDRVMSLAIANQMRQVAFIPEYYSKHNDFWSMDWWARTLEPERRPIRIGHQR